MAEIHFITEEQALTIALLKVGIENSEYHCLSNTFEGGYFRIIIWTPYLKYELYVDAEDGELAGIDTVPVQYQDALCFCSGDNGDLTNAA